MFCVKALPNGSNGKKSTCNSGAIGDWGSIPGLGRSPGEANGNPLQYSCLGNPMDRGGWPATVHYSPKVHKELGTTEWLSMHSVLKRTEVLNNKNILINIKCMLLSERNQSGKATYGMIPTIWQSGKGKTVKTLERPMATSLGKKQGQMNRWNTWIFRHWHVYIIHLSNCRECATPRMNLNVNYRLRWQQCVNVG